MKSNITIASYGRCQNTQSIRLENLSVERMIIEAFSSIVKEGADDWIPGAGPHGGQCRISGESSPVIDIKDFDTL